MSDAKEFPENGLAELFRKYKNCDCGTIFAYCGGKTTKENQNNSAKLKTILIGAEFSVTAIDGFFTENYNSPDAREIKKNFFLVFNYKNKGSLKDVLTKLGGMHEQNCISFSGAADGVHSPTGTAKRENSYPGYKKILVLDVPLFGEGGRFHSAIQGSPFVFAEAVSEEYHAFNDTLLNSTAWHKQVLVREYEDFAYKHF